MESNRTTNWPTTRLAAALTAAWLGLIASPSFAADDPDATVRDSDSGLMLFPAITGYAASGAVPELAANRMVPELDVFYSKDNDRLRFLTELLARSNERDVERFQVGWLASDTTTVWAGRFHNLLGLWNSNHHHGAFMQTSIQSPSIAAYEDEGGILPAHIVGVQIEGSVDAGPGNLNYAAVLGRGPAFRDDELHPVRINSPGHDGKQSAALRLGYRPQTVGGSEFGIFGGHTRIPVNDDPGVDLIAQTVSGAFYTWEKDKTQLIGELFHLSHRLDGTAPPPRSSFNAAYLQMEYKALPQWTAYGRLEDTWYRQDDPYLGLFPNFVPTRAILGSRFGLARNQALKLELSRNDRVDDKRFNLLNVQWSMVYP